MSRFRSLAGTAVLPVLTFGNPTHAAAFFAAAAVLALSAGAISRGRRRILLWACSLLLLTATVLSGSFAGILALSWPESGSAGGRWVDTAASACGCCWRHPPRRRRDRVGTVHPNTPFTRAFDVAAGIRPQTYWIALKVIAAHPLLGVGPADFQSALLSHLTPELVQSTYFAQIAADAHNWILETAATYGLPFAAVLAWLFLGPLIRGRGRSSSQRPFAAATLALAVAYLFGPLALSTLPLLGSLRGDDRRAPGAGCLRDRARVEHRGSLDSPAGASDADGGSSLHLFGPIPESHVRSAPGRPLLRGSPRSRPRPRGLSRSCRTRSGRPGVWRHSREGLSTTCGRRKR